MFKGIRLWIVWLLSLGLGIYGTGLVYDAITKQHWVGLITGIPTLLLGIWMTGNILASAKIAYRRNKAQSMRS